MPRPLLLLALLCAGCIVVVTPTPAPTSSVGVITSTRAAPTLPPVTATPAVIAIVTPTATATAPSPTPPPPTETPPPTATGTETATGLPPTLLPSPTASVPPNATAAPIGISLFAIAPEEIRPGDLVTLTWQAAGEQAALWRIALDGRLVQSYTVPLSGTLSVASPPDQQGRLDFALFATAGASTAQAFVSVRVLCLYDWFMAPAPADCPAGPPRQTLMAAERFEHGLMLWTQFDDLIHVLYSDGASPYWDALANAWFAGQPEDDPDLVPPPGLFQPRRGFGVAWRTGYVSPSAVVRDRLGWAIEPEFEIPSGHWQCDAAPRYARCYVTGPGGVVYVLQPERSGWGPWP